MSDNNSVIYGLFVNNLWRDEKTGKSFFRFKTKHTLFMECMYASKETIRNKQGIDEVWYTMIIDASNLNIPAHKKGTPLCIKGVFNPKMNLSWEFVALDIEESSNDDELTIIYLSSEQFPDITEEVAEKIVSITGADIHKFLNKKDCVKILMDVTALSKECVENIIYTIKETSIEKQIFQFLSMADIPYPYCSKAIRYFGKKALEKLMTEPYQAGAIIGLSFLQCDKLHKALNGNAYETKRLQSACRDVMDMLALQGHIYTPITVFKNLVCKKLKNSVFQENIAAVNVVAVMPDDFAIKTINYENCIYSKKLLAAEKNIAKNIKRIAISSSEPYTPELISYAEKACNIKYGIQQKEAFTATLSKRGVKIITGGPGTGKTTTIKGILLAYQRMHPNHTIKLCAPTGRASQRMSESTGMPATTIHRLLDFKPYGTGKATHKDANDPIEADLIVVDEMSMTDVVLFDLLLEAIKTGTSLILVGDIHQLESVGPGSVLHDLLEASNNIIQKSLLTEVFRQKGGSLIIDNSEKINNGLTNLGTSEDFQIITTESEEESFEVVKKLCNSMYQADKPFDTQVLCPARTGMAGIDNLNASLHDILNPNGKALIYGKQTFRIGDKIIMTKNNTTADYYNGDIGVVLDVEEHGLKVNIRDNEIILTKDMLEDIKLAYGMTIHKSQGSEFQNVIVVMPMNPSNMLVRNLFYTGVTRAKKKVFIINESSAMQTAIKVDKSGSRRTLLSTYLI